MAFFKHKRTVSEASTEPVEVSEDADAAQPASDGSEGHTHHIVSTILWIILSFLGFLLFLSYRWAVLHFANLNMDEIIYSLSSPLEGTGTGLISDYILKCVVVSIIITVAEIFAGIFLRKKSWYKYITYGGIAVVSALTIFTVISFWKLVDFGNYIKNKNVETDFYEKNYIDPSNVDITFPEKKRNLIFIYMESMEISFANHEDGGGSNEEYIPELVKLAQENEDFSGSSLKLDGGYSFPGTTWTMGGIVATTAGLPLDVDIDDNEMGNQTVFFPNLKTLGDILHEQGYTQVFECGSDATFGGRRLWFSNHGDYSILDYDEAKEEGLIPDDYDVYWGFEDAKLFEFAKKKITELAAKDEPFNYTMLTIDTHNPSGYTCEDCEDDFHNKYENVLHCSSKRVADFVAWVQQQDFYDNTTIVITGDHPSMVPSIKTYLDDDYIRRTYTCYINSAITPQSADATREFSTFDGFPTTLAALGADIKGNRLGLGTNLFSNTQTLTEKYGYEQEKEYLSQKSSYLADMETIDSDTQKLVAEYSDFTCSAKVQDDTHFNFEVPKLEKDSYLIKTIQVKVWYYDDGGYYDHEWFPGEENDDGSWTVPVHWVDCAGATEVNYQLIAETDKGWVNIGKQQVLTLVK